MALTPSSFPEYARLYPMSKSAKARTAKSLSTLSSLPSQACATWPRLYRWKHKNHTFLTHRHFFPVTNLYKDSPALFPVDNDVRDTGGYQTIDSPAGSDQGVMVDKVVTKGSGQHLDFCWKIISWLILLLHPKDVDRRHPLPLVDHLQEQTHQELQHRTDYLMRVWELLVLKSDVRLLLLWSLYLEHCVDDDMLPVLVNQAVGKVTPHLASFGSALKKQSYISGSSPILTGWTQGFQRARPLCWCRWRQGRGWSGWWWCLRWRREEATWRWPDHGQ